MKTSSEILRPAAFAACCVALTVIASACGSSGDGGSDSTASRQASASPDTEVIKCPNESSKTRNIDYINKTGIPLRITAGTANCGAFSETGNPTGINSRIVEVPRPSWTITASQRLEIRPCSSQVQVRRCVWDATKKVYTNDCTLWAFTIARGDANPGRVLGTVDVHYCGFAGTDQTIQIRLNDGEAWGNSVRFNSVVDAKPVSVSAGRSPRGPRSGDSVSFFPLLTITTG